MHKHGIVTCIEMKQDKLHVEMYKHQ